VIIAAPRLGFAFSSFAHLLYICRINLAIGKLVRIADSQSFTSLSTKANVSPLSIPCSCVSSSRRVEVYNYIAITGSFSRSYVAVSDQSGYK
jgi:hypothetical protein